ncbi:MAG: tRNA 2-thiouridine(34) synthase MnmA [Nitrospirae bacterium]|nr:tRNA 2-thiouridine(34) synthase MnmA [Nitrospirota bacterium]NTW65284.1 tRNA 2-thiouridine(34) synthase MnmA [Nitrospirota bacterium]
MTNRILVAMSGGVDSSFTAALLLEQGHRIEGVTMKLSAGVCCDIASAQAVCAHLGISHRIIDMQWEFERSVVSNFISEYRAGRTPNPCIRCNDIIKFQALLDHARDNGFDFLATGHYARIERDTATPRYLLKTGIDAGKDQSYFLYRLTQDQLARILFPLGRMHKKEVRERSRQLKLPAAERPESQEICFVPDNDYRAFLEEHAPDVLKRGEITMTDGTVVGKHKGIAFFTIGQRRKLGVAAGERLYVTRIEPETGHVVLGKVADLQKPELLVAEPNFITCDALSSSLPVEVKIRYRSSFEPAVIEPAGPGRVHVRFRRPVAGISPGQAAVFYDGEVVVGGGTIEGR